MAGPEGVSGPKGDKGERGSDGPRGPKGDRVSARDSLNLLDDERIFQSLDEGRYYRHCPARAQSGPCRGLVSIYTSANGL